MDAGIPDKRIFIQTVNRAVLVKNKFRHIDTDIRIDNGNIIILVRIRYPDIIKHKTGIIHKLHPAAAFFPLREIYPRKQVIIHKILQHFQTVKSRSF